MAWPSSCCCSRDGQSRAAVTGMALRCRRECNDSWGQLEESYCLSLPESVNAFSSKPTSQSCAAWLPTAMGSTPLPRSWPPTTAHPIPDWGDSLTREWIQLKKIKSILGREKEQVLLLEAGPSPGHGAAMALLPTRLQRREVGRDSLG